MKRIELLAVCAALIFGSSLAFGDYGLAECGWILESSGYDDPCPIYTNYNTCSYSIHCGNYERGHNLCCVVEYPSVCYGGSFTEWKDTTNCHWIPGEYTCACAY